MLLQVKRTGENGLYSLALIGILDMATISYFQDNVDFIYNEVQKLSIDFADLEFIDSTGIGGLAQVLKKSKSDNKTVNIINIQPTVYEILNILGLPEMFEEVIFQQAI